MDTWEASWEDYGFAEMSCPSEEQRMECQQVFVANRKKLATSREINLKSATPGLLALYEASVQKGWEWRLALG